MGGNFSRFLTKAAVSRCLITMNQMDPWDFIATT